MFPFCAECAADLNGAARELAQKTAAFAGQSGTVSITWRNLSSLGSPECAQAREAFEAALKEAGAGAGEAAQVEARVTVSESAAQYLLVVEARKGDERQVWIAGWNRGASVAAQLPRAALEKKLVWQQEEQILDAAFPGDLMLLLTPSNLVWFSRQNGEWTRSLSLPITAPKSWPRDVRGRLRVNGGAYQAYLPGVVCKGVWQPPASMDCKPGDDPWVLESGKGALLLAQFARDRNYFDGRIVTQTGARKSVPAFYSAASAGERGSALWLLTALDGRVRLFNEAFDPAGEIDSWGSDIAGVETRCGGPMVLATRPGDASEPDAVEAFSITNRTAVPATMPAQFPGPVTALWVSGGDSALAVSKDLSTGYYAAYLLSVSCGQ